METKGSVEPTLEIAALVDVVGVLRTVNTEFALISQRRTGNLCFRTFHAEQRSAGKRKNLLFLKLFNLDAFSNSKLFVIRKIFYDNQQQIEPERNLPTAFF